MTEGQEFEIEMIRYILMREGKHENISPEEFEKLVIKEWKESIG